MKKKYIFFALFCLVSTMAFAQWRPNNPSGLICRDTVNRDIIILSNMLKVGSQNYSDVILYDSIGHFIREFKFLSLYDPDEVLAYRIIYKFIVNVNGWVCFDGVYVPTLKKEEEE